MLTEGSRDTRELNEGAKDTRGVTDDTEGALFIRRAGTGAEADIF